MQALMNGLFGEEGEGQHDMEQKPILYWVNNEQCNIWSEGDICKHLSTMRNGFASGLLPVLSRLYNECLKFGVFPRIWKIGSIRISPQGQNKDLSNVRS